MRSGRRRVLVAAGAVDPRPLTQPPVLLGVQREIVVSPHLSHFSRIFPADAERSALADLLDSSRLYHKSQNSLALLDFVARLHLRPLQRHAVAGAEAGTDRCRHRSRLDTLLKAAGQVEAILNIAAETPFAPMSKPGPKLRCEAHQQDLHFSGHHQPFENE